VAAWTSPPGAPISPGPQESEHGPERFAVSRERVDARNGWSWVDLSVNEPSVLQFPKTVGHHAVGKAGDGTFEFAEAGWPLQQEKQKLERPPLAQHLQLPCEVLRQLKRDLVSTTRLASHSTAHSCLLTVKGNVPGPAGEKLEQPVPTSQGLYRHPPRHRLRRNRRCPAWPGLCRQEAERDGGVDLISARCGRLGI